MSRSFFNILHKNHYLGLIAPLFSLVFLFSSIVGSTSGLPVQTTSSTPVIISNVINEISKKVTDATEIPEKITAKAPKDTYLTTENTRKTPAEPQKTTSSVTLASAKSTSQTVQAKQTASTAQVVQAAQAPSGSYMTLNGRTLSIFHVSSTSVNSGSQVALFGSKFYYGHRSSVFGSLASLGVGSTFTITLDGETVTYRVTNTAILNHSQKDENGRSEADRHMNALVQGRYNGGSYDVVLMTCAGESLSGGDATDRLVVFANRL